MTAESASRWRRALLWVSLGGAVAAQAAGACGGRSTLSAGRGEVAAGGGGGAAAAGGSGGAGDGGAAGGGGEGGAPLEVDVVRACVVASSCADLDGGVPWPAFSASACVEAFGRLGWHFSSPSELPDPTIAARLLECAATAAAGDCAAFRSCFGGGWVSLSRCREGGMCQGNTLVAWGPDGPGYDCGTIGATCMDLWSGAQRACCNAEVCSQSSDVTCAGTQVEYCGGWGEHVEFDCGASGRLCQSDLWDPCVGPGAACAPDAPVTCAGSVASYCSGGALAVHDCSQVLGRTACAEGAPSQYGVPCRPSGDACDPTSYLGACEGDDLVLCVDGELRAESCAALGFAACELFDVIPARCAAAP
jgi:hypothetical protein